MSFAPIWCVWIATVKLPFFTAFQNLWRKPPRFYCFHYHTIFLVTCPDFANTNKNTLLKSAILFLQECKGTQTGGCVSPNNTRAFKHCSGLTKLHLDTLLNTISSKLLQSHLCLEQPVGLYLEIRDGHNPLGRCCWCRAQGQCQGQPCMCWMMNRHTRPCWWAHPSCRQWPTPSSWQQGCFIFPLLRGGKKRKKKKPTIRKRFISKRSRAMLDLHIFSCFPKAAHVRYFLSFMLLAGMHHEVQNCNLLSVLVIKHDFLCLLIWTAANCSLL